MLSQFRLSEIRRSDLNFPDPLNPPAAFVGLSLPFPQPTQRGLAAAQMNLSSDGRYIFSFCSAAKSNRLTFFHKDLSRKFLI